MLRADVVVPKRQRLSQGELEDLLRPWRERDLTHRQFVALADDTRDLDTDFLDRDAEGLEHSSGEPLLLSKQPEQQMLGPDVVVLQRARFVLREDDYLPGALREALEHTTTLRRGAGREHVARRP